MWEQLHHLWSSINHYRSFSLCLCHLALCREFSRPFPLSLSDPGFPERSDRLFTRRPLPPVANEEEEAALTDIIITVLLGSARGPFCGVITVLSSTHKCIPHYFTHLQYLFVFFFFKCTKTVWDSFIFLMHQSEFFINCIIFLYEMVNATLQHCLKT